MLIKVYLVLLRMGVWSVGGIPLVTVIRNTCQIILTFLQALSMSIVLGWIKMVPLITVIFHFESRKTPLSKEVLSCQAWWTQRPRYIFHLGTKKQKDTVMFSILEINRYTVMLSMVEMPKVIFSPDSAGMRKTNLRGG